MSNDRAATFEQSRPALFALAYRMLGSVSEAEDVVQDAWLRYDGHDGDTVRSIPAFLTTVVTRLCIDQLRSARTRRETYFGPWLPEPLVNRGDPAELAALSDSLSMAFLVLLEELSPIERAAFVLREVFDYPYETIATVVQGSEVAARQMVSRARQRLSGRQQRYDADRAQGQRLSRAFLEACGGGDTDALMDLLRDDITVWTDGGGRVRAAARPVRTAFRAARFLVAVTKKLSPIATVTEACVNGQPGLVIIEKGQVTSVLAFGIVDGLIAEIRVVTNPDKLRSAQTA